MRGLVGRVPVGQDLLVVEGAARGHLGVVGVGVEEDEGAGGVVVVGVGEVQADGEGVAHLVDGIVGQHGHAVDAALVEGLLHAVLHALHGDLRLDVVGRRLGGSEEFGRLEGDQQGHEGQDQDGHPLAHGFNLLVYPSTSPTVGERNVPILYHKSLILSRLNKKDLL